MLAASPGIWIDAEEVFARRSGFTSLRWQG